MVNVSNLIWYGITLQDIYDTNRVQIPEGYEYWKFALPCQGEKFIIPPSDDTIKDRHFSIGIWESSEPSTTPRIIVRQISQIEETLMTSHKKCFTKTWTIKEIYGVEDPVIPEGYEAIEFRPVNYEEDYLVQSGTKDFWDLTCPSAKPFLILRKQKKLYAKIPLISFIREETSTYIQFQNIQGRPIRVDMSKDIEIIEE